MPRTASRPSTRSHSSDHAKDVADNRFMAALAYVWVLCVIPLVTRKHSSFAQFHAKQGVVVALAWFVLWLIGWLPLLNVIIAFPGMVLLMAINLLAIIRTWRGEEWKIPYLYDYVIAMDL